MQKLSSAGQCLLFLLLPLSTLFAQNLSDGILLNPAYIQAEPSQFGPIEVTYFNCGDEIILDGSASMGEDSYFIELEEWDLLTWTAGTTFFSNWICTGCTVPNNIDVLSFFPAAEPQCGQIYKLRLATGPVFATKDFFFAVDCGTPPLTKTFSTRITSVEYDPAAPVPTRDYCYSAYEDPASYEIQVAGYTNGTASGGFDPYLAKLDHTGLKLPFDRAFSDVQNDQLFHNNPAYINCPTGAVYNGQLLTGTRDDDLLLMIDNVNTGNNAYSQVFGNGNGTTEVGQAIIQDPDQDIVAVGYTTDGTNTDVFAVGLDVCQNVKFIKQYTLNGNARATAVTTVSGLVHPATGPLPGFQYALTGQVGNDVFLLVIDPMTGDPVFSDYQRYDITNNSRDEATDIIEDANGDLVITGTAISQVPVPPFGNQPLYQPFLLKLNKGGAGSPSWASINQAVAIDILNSPDESSQSLIQMPSGDYVITGFAGANYSFVGPASGVYASSAHITRVGSGLNNVVFSNQYSDGAEATVGERISRTASGRLLLAGYTSDAYPAGSLVTFDYDNNIYVISTDSLGALQNCDCYAEAEATVNALNSTATGEVPLTADRPGNTAGPNSYSLFTFPTSFCEQYCPEPPPSNTCPLNGCAAFPVLNISTGVDAGGAPIALGALDPLWQLMNQPPITSPQTAGIPVAIPNMYAVAPPVPVPPNPPTLPLGWNQIPGLPASQAINVTNTAVYGPNNMTRAQPWRVRRTFCVCDTIQARIEGITRADDEGLMILYDCFNPNTPVDTIAATAPRGVGGDTDNFLVDHPFSWTGTLVPGTYHLEYEILNIGSQAMGFALSATVTDLTNNSTLSNPVDPCCGKGVITIQKLIDNDCDEMRSLGDSTGVGWQFQMVNTSTLQTYTATTNAFGEIIYRQLPYGTYTISETLGAFPWMLVDPVGNSRTVTISASNPVAVVDFVNQNADNCTCIEERITAISPVGAPDDNCCCFELEVDNEFGPYYDEIELVANGFTLNLLSNTSGLTPLTTTPNSIKVSSVIPQGTNQSMFTFCTADLIGASTATVNWYYNGNVVCTTDLDLECVQDTILNKTFDVTHQLQPDTLLDQFDGGFAGYQDSDGDFVSIGHALNPVANEFELAFAQYDYQGRVSTTPRLLPNLNSDFLEVVDAEEIVDPVSGANAGHLVLLYHTMDQTTSLARLDPAGTMLWLDQLDVLTINSSVVNARPYDFIIDGDKAVITGRAETSPATRVFLMTYDYAARALGCVKTFSLSIPGIPAPDCEGRVIMNQPGRSKYGIAALRGNDLVYFELDYNCTLPTATVSNYHFIDNDGATRDIPVQLLDVGQAPVVCGTIERNGNDAVYVSTVNNNHSWFEIGGYQTRLTDAVLNNDGNIILSGNVETPAGTRGFLAEVSGPTPPFTMNWAKIYYDTEYPRNTIQELDLAYDGGYYTIGFGINQNAPTSGFNFEYYDTWIMKTDPEGRLEDCDCFEDAEWTEEEDTGRSPSNIIEFDQSPQVLNMPYFNDSLLFAEYVCDRYCPDTCLISSILTPVPGPDPEDCCYTLDLYNLGSYAYKIQIDINTSGVFFDYGSVSSATNLFSYSPQSIVIDNSGALLPSGTTLNYFQFCLGNTGSTVPLQTFTIKYLDQYCNEIPECEQQLQTECLLECTDDDCLDIIPISVECDTLVPGKFKFTYQVINLTTNSVIDQVNWNILNSPGTVLSSTATPVVPPVGPGLTSTNQCIDIFDNGPHPKLLNIALSADGYILGSPDSLFCCHDQKDTLSIVLPQCCNPCDTSWVAVDAIPGVNGECCYELDILNTCPNTLSKIKVTSLTSGVNLGFHWNPNYTGTWTFNPITATEVEWTPVPGPYAPVGNYTDLVHFCLDNFGGVPNPQIRVEYITLGLSGQDSTLCEEIFELECEVDINCIDITEHEVVCDTLGNYYLNFCVDNVSSPPFIADELLVQKLSSTPGDLGLAQYTWNSTTDPLDFPFGPADPPLCYQVPITAVVSTPAAGDQLDLEFRLKNLAADTCCIESEQLSLILPPCPIDSMVCCQDSLGFQNAVQNGFVIIPAGSTVTLDNPLLGPCNDLNIDWGDGQFDFINASVLPISHTYASSGSFQICILVTETNDDGTLCWESVYCRDTPQLPLPECTPCTENLMYVPIDQNTPYAYFDLHDHQGTLYVAGSIANIQGQLVESVGRWDGTNWINMAPSGFDAEFEQLLTHQGQLWAIVNVLNSSGGSPIAFDLALWDPGTNDWTLQNLQLDLPSISTYGRLYTAVSHPNGILLGGEFEQVGGSFAADNIVLWDNLTNTFSAFGPGLDGTVRDIAFYGGDIVATGGFLSPQNQIARWDGTSWQPLAGGLQDPGLSASQRGGRELHEWSGQLLVGGRFSAALDASSSPVAGTKGLAVWDGSSWSSLGGGVTSASNFHSVDAMKAYGTDLYVAGFFSSIGGQAIGGLARWDGTTYQDPGLGTSLFVFDIECVGNGNGDCEIYIGAENNLGKLACPPNAVEDLLFARSIQLYPNPTNDVVTVRWDTQVPVETLILRDLYGREIERQQMSGLESEHRFDLSRLPDGVYLIQFLTPEGTLSSKRVVKQ